VRFVSGETPFGLDPADLGAHDDLLVDANEVHLIAGHPVKVLMRSHDVLHDFFVPLFRACMNMLAGKVVGVRHLSSEGQGWLSRRLML
jgi:cytochrome c oxidase subunit 2